jgi:hypothetical protein
MIAFSLRVLLFLKINLGIGYESESLRSTPFVSSDYCGSSVNKLKWYSDGRLNAFSEGAILSGWIGALLGAVIIAGNVKDFAALGPALAVMLLTVVYGYFIKALVRMVLISRSKE